MVKYETAAGVAKEVSSLSVLFNLSVGMFFKEFRLHADRETEKLTLVIHENFQ